MHNPKSVRENETHKVLWEFEIPTDHLISARRPNLVIVKKKKNKIKKNPLNSGLCRPCRPDLAKELKNLRNIKVMPLVTGVFSKVIKGLVQGQEDLDRGQMETVQTTALRAARIMRRVLKTWGDLLSLNSSGRPSADAGLKNLNGVYDNKDYSFFVHSYIVSSIPI